MKIFCAQFLILLAFSILSFGALYSIAVLLGDPSPIKFAGAANVLVMPFVIALGVWIARATKDHPEWPRGISDEPSE